MVQTFFVFVFFILIAISSQPPCGFRTYPRIRPPFGGGIEFGQRTVDNAIQGINNFRLGN
jgi:hypothetical protein